MLKDQTNQDFKDIVSLMGQKFLLLVLRECKMGLYRRKGTVTDISLSLSGQHSISVDGSDFFFYLSCLNFSF